VNVNWELLPYFNAAHEQVHACGQGKESRFSPLTTPHREMIFVLKQLDAKKYSPGIAVLLYKILHKK
jgi:hypothetical protein